MGRKRKLKKRKRKLKKRAKRKTKRRKPLRKKKRSQKKCQKMRSKRKRKKKRTRIHPRWSSARRRRSNGSSKVQRPIFLLSYCPGISPSSPRLKRQKVLMTLNTVGQTPRRV